jgi:hypothetical protein
MAIATGSKHTLHFVAESTYGTTPATPTWTPCPITGVTLGMTKDAIEAGKLRADRQVEDMRHGNRQIGGDISGELEYSAYDTLIQAMAMGTWTADVLLTGTTRRSFTFERFFDLDTDEYHRYTGCEINSMSLSVAPNAMVEVTFGVIGQNMSTNTAQVASSTYSPDVGNSPFDSFTGTITEGGSPVADVTSIELNWENGIEPAFVVGSALTIRPSDGKSRLTGTLTAYFQSRTLYDKFLNETSSEIVFTLTDLDGNSLEFDIPNVKYTSGNPDVSGEGPVTVALEFTALYSSADTSQIVITRTAA